MYQLLWIFFIYAFLGWCTEVSYAALVSGRFVNRGFLNGPWCPIYGLGVVIVLLCLEPLKGNLLLLFLGSVVLTSALEWGTGFVLEKIFHQRWWDYSNQPFNVGGYICLRFSILWGLACLFVVKLIHPSILLLIRLTPRGLGWGLLVLLGTVMAVDLAATVRTIAKINRRLSQLDQLAARIKRGSNEFGEDLAERVLDAAEIGADWKEELEDLAERMARRREELREDLDQLADDVQDRMEERRAQARRQLQEWRQSVQELLELDSAGQRRILKAFPDLRSTRYKGALERLRRRVERR